MNTSTIYYRDTDYYSVCPVPIDANDDIFHYFLIMMGSVFAIGLMGSTLYDYIFLSDIDSVISEIIIDTPEVRFFKEKTKKFSGVFKESESLEKYNTNIDSIFYNRKEQTEYFAETDTTDIEKQWKSRILIESTPHGNVIMYYNAYRQGFSYYSNYYISYSVLNAVAMKYVVMYRCLDFFVDSRSVPNTFMSPILKMIIDEEKDEIAKKHKMINPVKPNIYNNNNPFAKLKNYKIETKTSEKKDSEKKDSDSDLDSDLDSCNAIFKELHFNKFIYMGKTSNWSPLQLPKRNNPIFDASISTTYDEIFDNAQDQQTQVLDYKSYKLSLVMPTK